MNASSANENHSASDRNSEHHGHSSKKRGKRKGKSRQKGQSPTDMSKFWGDSDTLPERIDHVHSSPDVSAMVRSLGRMPIPPHEVAAEHSLKLVYQRAGILASALVKASGLDDEGDQ